jgi:CubicO group peptidase (beta-lactamase class C family)
MFTSMKSSLLLFALAVLSILSAAEPAPDAARIARVENGLLPPARIAGAKSEPWTLAARLAFYKVPGVSIAVIDGGTLSWARGYGLARAGDDAPVTPDTLFQAASISKPVAAAAALTLVDAGQLALDTDANVRLTSWKIPASPAAAAGQPVTLREILSHTAGFNVHGFDGYAAGAPRPTLLQVLDGVRPANSEPIRLTLPPGSQWRYAGGGYCVAQQLLIDVTREDFPTVMRQRVLTPAGMTASTFEQPLPASLGPRATAGHRSDGQRVEGDAHIYPEMAAAGLWTTPSDLARFALSLQHSFAGEPGLLSRDAARQMFTPPLAGSNYGLGIGVEGDGENFQLSHNGGNEGFRCSLVAYPRAGRGAIVMTNSDNGGPLINEILRALSREYGWPDYHVVEKQTVALAPEAFDAFVGRYGREDTTLAVFRSGSRYFMRLTGQSRTEIFPQSDHEFFLLDQPDVFAFERSTSGTVTHVVRRSSPPQIFMRVP